MQGPKRVQSNNTSLGVQSDDKHSMNPVGVSSMERKEHVESNPHIHWKEEISTSTCQDFVHNTHLLTRSPPNKTLIHKSTHRETKDEVNEDTRDKFKETMRADMQSPTEEQRDNRRKEKDTTHSSVWCPFPYFDCLFVPQ